MDRHTKLEILGQGTEHDQDGVPELPRSVKVEPGRQGREPAKSDPPGRTPTSRYGIYYAKTSAGSVPLMRTMMTTSCAMHCGYCPFGLGVDFERATWKREELVKTVLELDRAQLARGLFLTSGLAGNSVRVMDWMLESVRILREKHEYKGYVHLKILPGIEDAQIEEALKLADRVSLNLEAPTDDALSKIAPEKSLREDLALRLRALNRLRESGRTPRAGMVTQFVVGPGGETDRTLLKAVDRLYRVYGMRRAYFSAFTPVLGTPMEPFAPESPIREARLYQADWLLRFYGFGFDELPLDGDGNLARDRDPKTSWALLNGSLFPLEINRAPRDLLLRVPGLGPLSVERILRARSLGRINGPEDLVKLGVRTRRVLGFVLFDGKRAPGSERYFEHATALSSPKQLELFQYPRGFGRLPEDRRKINPAGGGTYV
jgi:predicted DNA-binding helix-hairpin-helix protein